MAWKTQQIMVPGERMMEVSGKGYYLTEMRPNIKFEKQKFLGHLHMLGLKEAILGQNLNGMETDTDRNKDAYTKFIQVLDDKSLSLIMRGASDNGREALQILCDIILVRGNPKLFLFIPN